MPKTELDPMAFELPPLPQTEGVIAYTSDGYSADRITDWEAYDDDQMQAYARSALLAYAKAIGEGWQPIETAPSDMPLILHEAGRVFKGGWCEIPFREFRDEDGFYTGQQDADAFWMDYGSGDSCNPTHWQHEHPLPQPPQEQS